MAYSPLVFLREAFEELKKVTWPSREDVIRLTVTVIIISVMVAIFLGGIDYGIEKLIGRIVAG